MAVKTDLARVYKSVDLFMYSLKVSLTLNTIPNIGDVVLHVDDTAGISVGNVITMFCCKRYYQSLVIGVTPTTVNLASPIDYRYDLSTVVEVGDWQLNVDGLSEPQAFYVRAPLKNNFYIFSMHIVIRDSGQMQLDKFGSLDGLSNGMLLRLRNNELKNLWIITNHSGIYEYGFHLDVHNQYVGAAIKGFALMAYKDLQKENGSVVPLIGVENDYLELLIRDDLRSLTDFTVTVHGHVQAP